jgi:C4-dicarboxylate-specific signal transduction histidine kinase
MALELRKTGISPVGDVPWGTHFCYFYETTQDLLDTLVPYFTAGLKSREFCLWIVSNSELLTLEEAKEALEQAMPDLERCLAEGSIEIVGHDAWFLNGEAFDLHRVANQFKEKVDETLARGYAGMRVNGSPAWLQKEDREQFRKFEEEVDELFRNEPIIASCTFPLACRGYDIFDVTRRHQFAIAKRCGQWEVLETPELKQAKAEIQKLNEELEQRVIVRTNELRVSNEELRKEIAGRKLAAEALDKAQAELAHVTRVMTMGELVASIAHEVNQPLGAIVTNGQACLRLLSHEPPGVDKSREVIERMVGDGMRASEVIKRIRALLKKTETEKAPLNINETIQEVVSMAASEAQRSKVTLLMELSAGLPPVVGDRVQLQQVILNLILNGRDAMSGVEGEQRELLISSRKTGSNEVMVAVRDFGAGLDPRDGDRIFEPFFTTKSKGMGLGLSISRTIIEAHGGKLWATPNEGMGTTIRFTLPAGARA